MEKNNGVYSIEMVVESFAIRNEDGFEEFRATTRERAELEIATTRERYERHSLNSHLTITRERAIIRCEVVRFRYPSDSHCHSKAGKIFYRIFHGDDYVTELDHKPKPMDLINACAYDVEWKVIE